MQLKMGLASVYGSAKIPLESKLGSGLKFVTEQKKGIMCWPRVYSVQVERTLQIEALGEREVSFEAFDSLLAVPIASNTSMVLLLFSGLASLSSWYCNSGSNVRVTLANATGQDTLCPWP
ncbi:uncharacterized protein LOC122162651 isoform X2 [Centrocercus urophasianus]|uniref:uncharacterized protein LOC122162651 isoform X2 n=1 Tax=Centrocercus urophasianus TaxID=9002 RepID=UPI001C64C09B|nr:uncharacterized protein LOC122162651 isoform X2 [Centrocercus urophasianus]